MSLAPLNGQAVLEIEFDLVFTTIDRMLGGPGKGISRTNLTDIERPLVRQVLDRLFLAIKGSWEQIVIINPTLETIETAAQFVQIAPSNDIVVTMLFEVKVGSQRHAMSICIPYLVLKPIAQKLSAQKWFGSANHKSSTTNKKHVVCQEIGHLFGLGHQKGQAQSCMNDRILNVPNPNQHDQDLVNSIY